MIYRYSTKIITCNASVGITSYAVVRGFRANLLRTTNQL